MSGEAIYRRAEDYDLEHAGDDEDSRFYCRILSRHAPARVLELGCGSGRVTLALAAALPDSRIVGLDSSPDMLERAQIQLGSAVESVRTRVKLELGDMRSWHGDGQFDAIVVPCCSVSHLVTMEDRLRTWRNCFRWLRPNGAFLLDVRMPDLATLSESQRTAPRALLQLDLDSVSESGTKRLIRTTAISYEPTEQRADIRFLYDRFDETEPAQRFVSNFESHVYFPSEMELLFATTGFTGVERYGAYDGSPFERTSPFLISLARR